ncbi:MAG: sugar ABC transporter substrate-binding protein [Thermotogaceae bacterium]|nr:sugar ABC transporter substrate-binding protein [Thermotogaceae bacterium]
MWRKVAFMLMLIMVSVVIFAAKEITICWASWPPADALLALSEEFTEKTGIKVKGLFVPWGQFLDKVSVEFAAKSPTIDILIADSQWLGWLVEGGHIIKLNDWIKELGINLDDFYPNLLRYYGEYPPGSGNYYGLPCETDAEILIYRKDLFEDPKEKEAFKKKYGYELRPPRNLFEMRDIAEFFTRPEQNLYGIATKWSKDYDVVTWDFGWALWNFGGDFWNPETYEVRGYANSAQAVAALEFYKSFVKFAPPGAANFSFDEVNTAMQTGIVAMAIQWAAFAPGFVDPEVSKTYDKVAFMALPPLIEGDPNTAYVPLGGQGMTVSAYSDAKEEVKEFIKWFYTPEVQKKWALYGGLTSFRPVVESPEFEEMYPWNKALKDSIPRLRDFWNIPEYAKLLTVTQENLNAVIAGTLTPREALNKIVEEHEKILREAGYIK